MKILFWKTIESNRRLRVRCLLFGWKLAHTDPWCNMLPTVLGLRKYEEAISDEDPLVVQILQISSFSQVLYKKGDLNNFSKFRDKHKKQSSGGVLSKMFLKRFAKFIEKHLCRSLFLINLQARNLELSEAGTGNVLQKIVSLKRRTGVSEPAVHRSSTK